MQGTTTTLQDLAGEAARCFETATREPVGDTPERFVRVKDGSPEWVTELIRAAHGVDADGSPSMLPDDWRYKVASFAVEMIAESDDIEDARAEFADAMVDAYTFDRIAWLGSNLRRAGYVDEAVDEFGPPDQDGIIERIGLGQYAEASEVYDLVVAALEERLEELDAAETFGEND